VSPRDLALRIGARLALAGLTVPAEAQVSLAAYLELLGRWNQKINLTAYTLAPPSDEAIDRLIVEPVAAAPRVPLDARLLLDVGSGGGSPALPLRIMLPRLRVVLVESKVRKCAFLREAARQLGLGAVEVENHRLEELLARRDLHEASDVVTVRAVRADAALWAAAQAFVRPGGRLFWFTTSAAPAASDVRPLVIESVETLLSATGSWLAILKRPEQA
jgi:16S rRNA (guanine527-N7)-methyltransferase